MWGVRKAGIVKYAWVCVNAPVYARSGKRRDETRKFWNDVNECLMEIERGNRIMLIKDMNVSVGNNEVAAVMGK